MLDSRGTNIQVPSTQSPWLSTPEKQRFLNVCFKKPGKRRLIPCAPLQLSEKPLTAREAVGGDNWHRGAMGPSTSHPMGSGLEGKLDRWAWWGPDTTGKGTPSVAGRVSRGGRVPSAVMLFLLLTVPGPYLLQQVGLLDSLQHTLLGGVLDVPSHQKLIQDEVGLLKVEDDVQFAHLGQGGEGRVAHQGAPSPPFSHAHSSHCRFLLWVSVPRPLSLSTWVLLFLSVLLILSLRA